MKYDLKAIETAFFNYHLNGGEQTELEYQNTRYQWQRFKTYLEKHYRVESEAENE